MSNNILHFYELAVDLFSQIIETGAAFWNILNTDIQTLIDDNIDLGIFNFVVDWITSGFGQYTIMDLMLGSGVVVFVFFVIIKFFKI